jgi:di/tripeptidase
MLMVKYFPKWIALWETPEETKGYEGFFHVIPARKYWRNCFEIIIRDHNKKSQNARTNWKK